MKKNVHILKHALQTPLFVLTVLTMSWHGARAQDDLVAKVASQSKDVEHQGYKFTTQVNLSALPVKNQASSGTCWSYSSSSFLESEMARMGNAPVDLSEMFTVRYVYRDKGIKYVRMHGNLLFAQGGALPDIFHVLRNYGAMPFEAYQGLNYGDTINKHSELENVLKGMLDAVLKNPYGKLSTAWRTSFEQTLDAYLGPVPEKFTYQGKTYTPRSFADQVVKINPDDYVQLTSFTHYPFYKEMHVEVPDNWAWGTSINLPLDEMMQVIDHALDNGFTINWATDVSEKGFSVSNGLAVVPADSKPNMKKVFAEPSPELTITQELRQQAFDNFQTTDDHGMHIIGRAVDQNGTKYYLVKNSWGMIENPYMDGYIYCSEAFLRYKTISFVVHKDALPKPTQRQLKGVLR